jgi:uncharacterized protein YkwD
LVESRLGSRPSPWIILTRGDRRPAARIERSAPGIILAALVLGSFGFLGSVRSPQSIRLNVLDTALLVQINVVREAHALSPLQRSPSLFVAATQHTKEMGRAGYFAHDSLDHTLFWKRIRRSYPTAGYRYWSVGENLLFSAPEADLREAMSLWMNSPKHRANILDPAWREIGIAARHFKSAPGIYGDESVTIITADFGVRRASTTRGGQARAP